MQEYKYFFHNNFWYNNKKILNTRFYKFLKLSIFSFFFQNEKTCTPNHISKPNKIKNLIKNNFDWNNDRYSLSGHLHFFKYNFKFLNSFYKFNVGLVNIYNSNLIEIDETVNQSFLQKLNFFFKNFDYNKKILPDETTFEKFFKWNQIKHLNKILLPNYANVRSKLKKLQNETLNINFHFIDNPINDVISKLNWNENLFINTFSFNKPKITRAQIFFNLPIRCKLNPFKANALIFNNFEYKYLWKKYKHNLLIKLSNYNVFLKKFNSNAKISILFNNEICLNYENKKIKKKKNKLKKFTNQRLNKLMRYSISLKINKILGTCLVKLKKNPPYSLKLKFKSLFLNSYKKKKINFNINSRFNFKYGNIYDSFKLSNTSNIVSAYNTAFLQPIGFFMEIKKISNPNQLDSTWLSELKKKIYSFNEPFEIQKKIISKYNSISENFAVLEKNDFQINESPSPYVEKSQINDIFFLKNNKHPSLFAYNPNTIEISNDRTDDYFKIKRIRFKPGYMRIWRNARKVLAGIMHLQHKYQYRLTRHISKYIYLIKTPFLFYYEMKLKNVILYSQFFVHSDLIDLNIKAGNIFINSFITVNPDFQIYKNDFIQLIVHVKYYLIFRIFIEQAHWKKLKIKVKLRKQEKMKQFDSDIENFKKPSTTLPKWIIFHDYWSSDIPSFLEIDYMTLSAYVIYDPLYFFTHSNSDLLRVRYGIMNMYNWKYIV